MLPSTQPELGRALATWREGMSLTQDEAAQRLGVFIRTLQRWEAGESMPRSAALARLEQAMQEQPTNQMDRIEEKLDQVLEILQTKKGGKR